MTLKPYKADRAKLTRIGPNGAVMPHTVSLFYGIDGAILEHCIFTIEDEDNLELGLYSFKKLYLSHLDPTEYEQAKYILNSIPHWERICRTGRLKPLIEDCRLELSKLIRSKAFKYIEKEALVSDSSAVRLSAQKFLVGPGAALMYPKDPEVTKKRGRPSKDEVDGNLKQMSEDEKRMMDDLERVKGTLHVN